MTLVYLLVATHGSPNPLSEVTEQLVFPSHLQKEIITVPITAKNPFRSCIILDINYFLLLIKNLSIIIF